jgi:RNA-directed DNA polymerase
MAKEGSKFAGNDWQARRSSVNTGAPWPDAERARARVLGIQRKLHRWAGEDRARQFVDLYNLICDPAVLMIAWRRVRSNTGARSAGVDGETAYYVETVRGVSAFLCELQDDLKARRFRPELVREVMIPKPGGKRRRLGIATVRDRVVQAAVLTVLEPIFEVDFHPCSYGFRPKRRAQDAIAEVHFLASHSYEWVLEGDIEACFDNIDHAALMDRVRRRVTDKRVLGLVKAFCKAGILGEDGAERDTNTGTPQGGILSPLLSNIALSVLDEHFAEAWAAVMGDSHARAQRRRRGLANYRLVRYADDFLVMVAGTEADAQRLCGEVVEVLGRVGLRLSPTKTTIAHIDEGLDFLGFRIQRHQKRGAVKRYVYTYPRRDALTAVKARIRALTQGATNQSLAVLLHRLNPVLRGWTTYFRHGASAKTFAYLEAFTWRRVWCWLRHKHRRSRWKELRRRYQTHQRLGQDAVMLFNPAAVKIVRYRYRGADIATPWTTPRSQHAA